MLQKKYLAERLEDLDKEINVLKTRLDEVRAILDFENKSTVRKFNQMVTRLAHQLTEENRLKRRHKSTGRPRLLDDECENFIAHCIEEKAASHGRQHDTVLYTGRRVKVKDLLHLAN